MTPADITILTPSDKCGPLVWFLRQGFRCPCLTMTQAQYYCRV